jgi:hypothetical protein
MKALIFILLAFSSIAYGQEQLAVRLNENGLMKIMQMALKYNTGTTGSRTVVVPKNIYKFKVKQKDLSTNKVIEVLNEISDLDFTKDLDFFLQSSDIKITGEVDQKSLATTIMNSKADGFDLTLSINISKVTLTATSLSLCEDRIKTKCGLGLKTTATGLKITTLNKPVMLTSTMRVSIKQGMASVQILSVGSNLESKSPPTLDVNFTNLEVPKISIIINDQETELDTSRLREQILARKSFMGKKLMAFAGDFIAADLAEMLNVYLKSTQVATTVNVYTHDEPVTFNDFTYKPEIYVHPVDALYVRPAFRIEPIQKVVLVKPAVSVMKTLMDQFTDVVRQARVDLSLKAIKTPSNKDIQLAGLLNFILNKTTYKVKNTLGNSTRTLPALDLSAYRSSDINLAISEPVINGALELVNSTGLFNELLQEVASSPELSINNVKLHFTYSNSLKAIINASVDLNKVRTDFWSDPGGWIETGIGQWLESDNNGGVIYFPLELEIVPVIGKNATTGEATLSIKFKSVFNGDTLLNTYKYPSNVSKMNNVVRKAVIKKLRGKLDEYANKTFTIDLKKFLNQSGVEFMPKSIVFNQAAYMFLNLDIKDIKFDNLNPNKK